MGEDVYVGGGTTDNIIFQYSWRRGVWNTLPECPVRGFGLTQYRGRLTTVGGLNQAQSATESVARVFGKGSSITGRVYEFVSESQRWQRSLPPMPTARSGVIVVSQPSSSPNPLAIAVCGGRGDGVDLNTVEVFCHSTSQWHAAEPLPIPLGVLTSASVGDITYLLGGEKKGFGAQHCMSVSLDSLIAKAKSPAASPSRHSSLWTDIGYSPLIASHVANLGGSMVTIAGEVKNSSSAAVYLLTSSRSWERMRRGDLPEPRGFPTAVCLPSGELMVVGGYDRGFGTRTVFIASIAD